MYCITPGRSSNFLVSVFMKIVLWLKSLYLAEIPVFPPKYNRGGTYVYIQVNPKYGNKLE